MGATNNVSIDSARLPNMGLLHFLMECAISQINQNLYQSNIVSMSVGNRPLSIDGFPLIGPAKTIDGLWIISGTYRDGFHCSPLIASYIADAITGKSDDNSLVVFEPERRPLELLSREESIEEFAKHYIGGAYEHGAKLPKFMYTQELHQIAIEKAKSIYDKLDIDYSFTPDILLLFMLDPKKDEAIDIISKYFNGLINN
ncbi:MAG: FAD-dependent oxidoreductase [Rickettsiaceae bacterium]|nr:FAD-dependent oxidoreductase [Rickettsiaceae bacterium]